MLEVWNTPEMAGLLGRDPVQLDERKIAESVADRSVLVTGGAGSIGSELCRHLATYGPARLIVFDRAESDLFRLDLELRTRFDRLTIIPEIGDVQDRLRVDETLRTHSVNTVFHAAAYKHVQMMEVAILQAVQNNVIGTWNVVDSALRHGVQNVVLISSDKAVNPSSVMGATKRVAELMVASAPASNAGTKLISVRFGNVLGTQGSVLPIFQEQIEQGGPVTITHPDMCRYFMTVQEAVQLILQASIMGAGGEIFVLDMGCPVNIVDLAHSLIRSRGKTPGQDIAIRMIGPRAGEKLREDLTGENETIEPTSHPKVKIVAGERVSTAHMERWLNQLKWGLQQRSETDVVFSIKELVPEWQPSSRWQSVVKPVSL